MINALKENGLIKVLAEPTLITMSGKPANFLAGGEFPIPVPQTGGTDNTITIEYKTYGVGLNFTPTVLGNGRISMEVAPEVSDLDLQMPFTIRDTLFRVLRLGAFRRQWNLSMARALPLPVSSMMT